MAICSATALRDSQTCLLRQKHASRLAPFRRQYMGLVGVDHSAPSQMPTPSHNYLLLAPRSFDLLGEMPR
jgi:hypothetical protein